MARTVGTPDPVPAQSDQAGRQGEQRRTLAEIVEVAEQDELHDGSGAAGHVQQEQEIAKPAGGPAASRRFGRRLDGPRFLAESKQDLTSGMGRAVLTLRSDQTSDQIGPTKGRRIRLASKSRCPRLAIGGHRGENTGTVRGKASSSAAVPDLPPGRGVHTGTARGRRAGVRIAD